MSIKRQLRESSWLSFMASSKRAVVVAVGRRLERFERDGSVGKLGKLERSSTARTVRDEPSLGSWLRVGWRRVAQGDHAALVAHDHDGEAVADLHYAAASANSGDALKTKTAGWTRRGARGIFVTHDLVLVIGVLGSRSSSSLGPAARHRRAARFHGEHCSRRLSTQKSLGGADRNRDPPASSFGLEQVALDGPIKGRWIGSGDPRQF
jgi:hypothetical protein